jgi:hypothetical protein
MDVSTSNSLKLFDAQTVADMDKMAKAQGYSLQTMDVQQVNDLAKASVLNGYEVAKGIADEKTQLAVNKLLTDNKLIVDTNSTAQKALSDYNTALNNIANNKDLSGTVNPETGTSPRQDAINNAAQALNNSLTVVSSISGIDLTGLLDFGDSGTASNQVGGTQTAEQTAADAAAAAAAAAATPGRFNLQIGNLK